MGTAHHEVTMKHTLGESLALYAILEEAKLLSAEQLGIELKGEAA